MEHCHALDNDQVLRAKLAQLLDSAAVQKLKARDMIQS
jgi:hypothetical protein